MGRATLGCGFHPSVKGGPRRRGFSGRLSGALLALGCGLGFKAEAGLPAWLDCPQPAAVSAQRLDALLSMAVQVRADLLGRGAPVALVSRSGLDLRAIGHDHSHSAWWRPLDDGELRQLYYDCRAGRPRVFDEALAGFLHGVSGDVPARLSIIEWPAPHAERLAATVADGARLQALVSGRYRAQSPATTTASLNCNQWSVEVLATAFGAEPERAHAQRWLALHGYQPSAVRLPGPHWLIAAVVSPHASLQGHDPQDLEQLVFRTSMPDSIEAFIRRLWPQATRTQWCLRGRSLVIRRGWEPLDGVCSAGPGDEVRHLAD